MKMTTLCYLERDEEYQVMFMLRRAMASGNVMDVTEEIIDNLSSTKSNADFVNFMLKKLH